MAVSQPQGVGVTVGAALGRAAQASFGRFGQSDVAARERALAAVVSRVQAALAAADAREGWSPDSGVAHPSGGYTHRQIVVTNDGGRATTGVDVCYGTADFVGPIDPTSLHRADGPSVVTHDVTGAVAIRHWYLEGRVHRGDGPASIISRGPGPGWRVYAYRGISLTADAAGADKRCATLTRWGADPATVVGWLAYEQDAGRGATRALVRARVGPDDALSCASAGVKEAASIIAVSRGKLPLSWAAAGA